VRETALLFDNKEAMNLGIQERTTESSPDTGRRGARGRANWKRAMMPSAGRGSAVTEMQGRRGETGIGRKRTQRTQGTEDAVGGTPTAGDRDGRGPRKVGKGGSGVGKWTGFSHVFPDRLGDLSHLFAAFPACVDVSG